MNPNKNPYLGSFINHKIVAYDEEFEDPNNDPINVGLPHFERLFQKFGTELDDVTMNPKVSVHTHLNVKNQDRQRHCEP